MAPHGNGLSCHHIRETYGVHLHRALACFTLFMYCVPCSDSAYSFSQGVEAACFCQSSVNFCQSAWHLIPVDENVKSYCHENFKPCMQKEHYCHHWMTENPQIWNPIHFIYFYSTQEFIFTLQYILCVKYLKMCHICLNIL